MVIPDHVESIGPAFLDFLSYLDGFGHVEVAGGEVGAAFELADEVVFKEDIAVFVNESEGEVMFAGFVRFGFDF